MKILSFSSVQCMIAMALSRLADAGISFGNMTSTDDCYAALQNAEMPDGSERVDKDGYVAFVNELSDGAFTQFRYDEDTNDWGEFPVVEFEHLPSSIVGAFYAVACGGAFVACKEAYLYTGGTRDDANSQHVAYLFGLCTTVEDAIETELNDDKSDAVVAPSQSPPAIGNAIPTATANVSIVETAIPTKGPSMTMSSQPPSATAIVAPTATANMSIAETAIPTKGPSSMTINGRIQETIVLTYRALVSVNVSSNELNEPNNSLRVQLLGAMSTWTNMTASEFNEFDIQEAREGSLFTRRVEVNAAEEANDKGVLLRGRRLKRDWREMIDYPKSSVESCGISSMVIFDVGE